MGATHGWHGIYNRKKHMNLQDTIQTTKQPAIIVNDEKDMMQDANSLPTSIHPEIDRYDLSFWISTAITVFAAGVVLGVLVSRKE